MVHVHILLVLMRACNDSRQLQGSDVAATGSERSPNACKHKYNIMTAVRDAPLTYAMCLAGRSLPESCRDS